LHGKIRSSFHLTLVTGTVGRPVVKDIALAELGDIFHSTVTDFARFLG